MLFADADGASSFPSLAPLQAALDAVEVPYPSSVPASVPTTPNPGAQASSSAFEVASEHGLRQRGGAAAGRTAQVNTPDVQAAAADGKLGVAIGSRAHLVSTDLVVKVRADLLPVFHERRQRVVEGQG